MGRVRHVLILVAALVLAWLTPISTSHAARALPVATYTYNTHPQTAPTLGVVRERGPPTVDGYARPQTANVELESHGTLARPAAAIASRITPYTGRAGYNYDPSPSSSAQPVVADEDAVPAQRPANVVREGSVVVSGFVVAAKGGGRVFWSGGDVAKNAGADYARANGAKTLEMTLTGKTLEKLPQGMVPRKAWDLASARFARGARGDAHVFFGPGAPWPGSTFARVEAPILQRQGNPIMQHFLEAP